MKKPLLILAGPTAVGKTALGIALAQRFNGEIVNADSMQIYRELSIGTAKPTFEEMEGIPHHMIDVASIHCPYTVGDYVRDANVAIEDICRRGKTPIMVGGTGMYIKALLYDYTLGGVAADSEIRKKFQQIATERGSAELHEMLKERDPIRASQLHINDTVRVVRALELLELVGKTETKRSPARPHNLYILDGEREELYARINARVDIMLARGLIEEVKRLLSLGASRDCQAMKAIGYKELVEFLNGKVTYEEAVAAIKQNTRRYAKRQLTLFRHIGNPIWIDFMQESSKHVEFIATQYGLI